MTLDIDIAHGILRHPGIQIVRIMAEQQNWAPKGKVLSCAACAFAKDRANMNPQATMTKSSQSGERLFLDISGSFMSFLLLNNKYWLKVVGQPFLVLLGLLFA